MATTERIESKGDLLKEAATALDLAQKREDATKLAFDMVERGKIPPFANYGEFQEKVASLMQKDLRVVEEALELDSTMPVLGKVASEGVPTDATAAFYHTLAGD